MSRMKLAISGLTTAALAVLILQAPASAADAAEGAPRGYGPIQSGRETVTIVDDSYGFGAISCRLYVRVTVNYSYQQDTTSSTRVPRVRSYRTAGQAASNCPLNFVSIKLGKTQVSQTGNVLNYITPVNWTVDAGIPTPWGTIGIGGDFSGEVITRFAPRGLPRTNYLQF